MSESTPRRSYDASGRQAQARVTKERILDAARSLFIDHGYAGTSIVDIAEAASVSGPTVFAHFGSKVTLLKECVDTAIVGDAEPVPLAERPEMVHARNGRTAVEVLERLAGLFAYLTPRSVPIYMVMYSAADADPTIRELARVVDEQRLVGATQLAEIVMERLGSSDRSHLEEIRDLIWTINSPQTISLLVTEREWSVARYEQWARRTLVAAVDPLPR